MSDDKVDPTKTYVLDETAITRVKTIEELAELALRHTESPPKTDTATDHRGKSRSPSRR